MGLKLASVRLLLPAIEATRRKLGARILLLGTQDLYFTYEQLTELLTGMGVEFEPVPEAERFFTNSFAFVSHEDWWKYCRFMHQKTFFRLFGFNADQIDAMDVSTYENAEIIHDMNHPVASGGPQYDLVLDTGTLEHVFDVKQAMWNICDLVRASGRIVHLMPANMLDHGFYNFNSTLLADFYRQAGWTQEELVYIASPTADTGSRVLYVRINPGEMETPPANFWLGLFGRFQKPDGETAKPVAKQGLYLDLHDAWTRQSREQSVHEPPPPRPRDRVQWLRERLLAMLTYRRALIAARRLKGELVCFDEPADRQTL
jgi:hypothetical protein